MSIGPTRSRFVFFTMCALAVLHGPSAFAQCSGFPVGGILSGILNTYYPGPNVASATAAAGATCIRVDNAARQGAAATIAAGDLLLVIQMQGATMDGDNDECYGDNTNEGGGACASSLTSGDGSGTTARSAGTYEYVMATSAVTASASACGSGVAGDSVSITGGGLLGGLINSYTTAQRTAAQGQQTYQVIRVPQYQTAQVGNAAGTATVTASAWNGRSGGIVAFDVAATLTVQTNSGVNPPPAISANGLGFRGGVAATVGGAGGAADSDYRRTSATAVHANKAEGLAGTPSTLTGLTTGGAQGYPNGDRARGGPGNAGGGGSDGAPGSNDQNTGGGGGGNGGKGGKGGNAWNSGDPTGGWGGAAYTAATTQLLMGGGGGAGTNNNNAGKSGGASGGGMIFVRANTVTGTATFSANGTAAIDTDAPGGDSNDGGGGGGAGGTIVVLGATALPATLTLSANGGFGANANAGALCVSTAHGPGGGGAGGVILTSNTSPARSVTGANPGLTNTTGSASCTCNPAPANKAPSASCLQYGATAGAAGQTLTTTINGLPGVRTCVTSTRASLAGLLVDPQGGISFATASERNTLAFRLYESDARGGDLRPLTDAAIPAQGRARVGPSTYRAETLPLERPFVVVEEIETTGRRRRLGPFATADTSLRAGFGEVEQQVEREAAARLARAASRGAEWGKGPGRGRVVPLPGLAPRPVMSVKVTTQGAGPVTVSTADLLTLGVPLRVLRSSVIRAYNLGSPVALERILDNRELVGVRFLAEPLATDFTADNVYVLTFGAQPPPAPAAPLTRSGPPTDPGAVRVEEDSFYVPWVPLGADPWAWGVVFEDVAPAEFTFDLPGLAVAGPEAAVRVHVVGATDGPHEVTASLNGTPLGTVQFTGKTAAAISAAVPPGALSAAGNVLALEYASEDPAGFALFNAVDLGAQAQLAAPASVRGLEVYDPRLEGLAGLDYLIVAPSEFAEAATRLARAKHGEGRRARVLPIERAFDRFTSGLFEANGVAALLREARRQSPRLRYVLLLGDDTFDPRDRLGLGLGSRVPSLVAFDGEFGRVPSERAYADTDGDGAPDLAIGRLPAATAEEALRLVEKVERQADLLRPGRTRQVLAVDNEGAGDVRFRRMADDVATVMPAPIVRVFADIGEGVTEARSTLLQALQDGASVVHYFGHGAHDFWADEHLLDATSAEALAGAGRASLALAWTCESDWYQYHLGKSLGESLLLLPDGGTVASFGPSGITNPRAQVILQRRLYPLLNQGVPVGEAIRRAKAAVAREEPWALPVVDGFNLLGDPSLTLP